MTDEVQRSLEYNLLPRRWPEVSMLSDGESATVPNPQLGQLQETVTPFISDTEQQEGKLNTPVDPLTTQDFWIPETVGVKISVMQPSFFYILMELRESRELKLMALDRLKALKALVRLKALKALDRLKTLHMLQALKMLHTLQASDMLKALDALKTSDLLDVLETLEQQRRLERIRALRIFRWTLTKKVPASFSLKELISLLKSIRSGWGPPLEMATRMLNSKFWVMEADVWADLLIVCCWANPTIYCEKCRNNVKLATTSCKHVVCPVCTVGQGNDPSCPECGQALTVSFSRKRRLCDPTTTATKRPCTDSASKRSYSQESRSKSFTIDNLSELLEYLYPAAVNKWYFLGLALGLHVDILEGIATKQRDKNLDCLKDMLITRLRTEKLSKEELIQSLQKPTVGLSELAQTLKDSKQW